MIRITQQAHAKLNLLLSVTPEVTGGKHLLNTVFTAIDLADILTFTLDNTQSRAIEIELISAPAVPPLDLPTERNIVYTAVETMEKICGRSLQGRLHVVIEKHIPHAAGLAGGSTDAAATLRAVAELWGMSSTDAVVQQAAQMLGADVSFFLYEGCALMGGHGEKLLRRLPQPTLDLVVVKPAEGVSTAAAYAAFDAEPQPAPSAERLVELLERPVTRPEEVAAALANNLYPAACTLMPQLGTLIAELKEQSGVYTALLTGSGSAVFGICESPRAAKDATQHFERQGYWARPCTPAPAAVAKDC
jgi:4-diphosphocytidyl-2-C-methyl-D-erythritol kinase